MNENTKPGAEDLASLLRGALDASAEQRGQLFAGLYQELHRLAQRELRRNAHATLSPTTLLHETYINLASREGAAFPDRAHFMAYAARAMRGLLIDYLRNRHLRSAVGNLPSPSCRWSCRMRRPWISTWRNCMKHWNR